MLVTLAACQAKKSENPLSPSVAGPIPGVEISAPGCSNPPRASSSRRTSSRSGSCRELGHDRRPQTLLLRSRQRPGLRQQGLCARRRARGGRPHQRSGRRARARTVVLLARDDGANKSTFSTAGFELLPRAVFTVPTAASPVNNAPSPNAVRRCASTTPRTTAPSARELLLRGRQGPGHADRGDRRCPRGRVTQWTVDRDLDYGLTHYWRVRGTDGEITTDWSPTAVFKAPAAPAPPPGGGGGGSRRALPATPPIR